MGLGACVGFSCVVEKVDGEMWGSTYVELEDVRIRMNKRHVSMSRLLMSG